MLYIIGLDLNAHSISKMVKEGKIKENGIYGPEAIVPPTPFFRELKKRGMKIYEDGEEIV